MTTNALPEGTASATPVPAQNNTNARLNWLRAGVLGANDGVASTSGLIIGVAAAGASSAMILTSGLAGLAAGALSMAAGEYVSVSTQRDTEKALIDSQRRVLEEDPAGQLEELAAMYRAKGLDDDLAQQVAEQLTQHDALDAHLETKLGLDSEYLTNPWAAALASMVSFTIGAALPLLVMMVLAPGVRIVGTLIAAVVALAITGYTSARLGGANRPRAMVRNAMGGMTAMGITYLIGLVTGTQLG